MKSCLSSCKQHSNCTQFPVLLPLFVWFMIYFLLFWPPERLCDGVLHTSDRRLHHHNVKLASSATVCCLPGSRALDVEASLRVLASRREKQGTRAHSNTSYSNSVIHAGADNIRSKQSEITKDSLAWTFQGAWKMYRHRCIVSGPLPQQSNDSRLYSQVKICG